MVDDFRSPALTPRLDPDHLGSNLVPLARLAAAPMRGAVYFGAALRGNRPRYSPSMGKVFRCPNCDAAYWVEHVEAAPTHRQVQVICIECGGPLRNREGKFVLIYRRKYQRPNRGRVPLSAV